MTPRPGSSDGRSREKLDLSHAEEKSLLGSGEQSDREVTDEFIGMDMGLDSDADDD